jgi:acetyltransferase-like isoleucine patch superfamily enzyme
MQRLPPVRSRLLALPAAIGSAWRIVLARWSGAKIGPGCRCGRDVDVARGRTPELQGDIEVGARCELQHGVLLHPYGGRIRLGANVFIGPGTVLYGHGGLDVGEDTLLSMHCRILSSNHTVPPPDVSIRSQPDIPLPTRIGRDVWLGAGVTVLGGVTIGEGCVVAAGAVVTRSLPPFSISAGVPAVVKKYRHKSHG